MDDLLKYAFEGVRSRQLRDAFVGATEVATKLSGVAGLRKAAWAGKVRSDAGFIAIT